MKTTNGHRPATPRLRIFLFAILAATTIRPWHAMALQRPPVAKANSGKASEDLADFMSPVRFAPDPTSVFLPPSRDMMRPLIRAIRVYHEGDVDRSAELIGEFLADSDTEDFLVFAPQKKTVAQTVVDVANSMLGQFPSSAIESLQVRFGIPAKQRLNRAIAAGDYREIAQVMRRYFYTLAGQEAALLMGHYHLDSDHPLLGARCFQMVMDRNLKIGKYDKELALLTGMSWYFADKQDLAIQVFRKLASESEGAIKMGDRQVNFNNNEPLASIQKLLGNPAVSRSKTKLAQWPMLGGRPSRNARLPDGFPVLQPIWKVSTVDQKQSKEKIYKSREILADSSPARRASANNPIPSLVPSNIPLVVDGTVLAGDGKRILGIDFQTGKRIWSVPASLTGNQGTANLSALPEQLFQRGGVRAKSQPASNSPWTDYLKGHVSSDGRRVYRLKEASVDAAQINGLLPLQSRSYSRNSTVHWLQALDVFGQGTVVWQAGIGQKIGDPKLGEISFLGSPLPVEDKLYAIGKRQQEIVLVAIDADSGTLLWMQTLATNESTSNVRFRPINTKVGHSLTPSYADGILVCPTGKDALVGIDILSQSVLWGNQATAGKSQTSSIRRSVTTHSPQLVIDGSIVVGLEIGTSPRLMVLDLLTGQSLLDSGKKSVAASKVLYVAGIHQGSMILVEKDSIRCVAIKTGKSIWNKSIKAIGQPTGRGYLTKNAFYLPTDENLIVEFDLESGKIRDSVLSDEAFGNLIVHQGTLISQTETFVACHLLDSTARASLASAIQEAGDLESISPQLKILQVNLLRAENRADDALALLKTVSISDQGDSFKRELLRIAIELLQSKSDSTPELIDLYGSWFEFDEHPELFLNYVELLVQQGRVADVVERLFKNEQFFSSSKNSLEPEFIYRPATFYDLNREGQNQADVSKIVRELPPHIQSKIGLSKRRIGFSPNQWAKSQLLSLSQSSAAAKLEIRQFIDQKIRSLNANSALDQFAFYRQLPITLVSAKLRNQLALDLIASNHVAEAEHLVATLTNEIVSPAAPDSSPSSVDVSGLSQKLAAAQESTSSKKNRQTLASATPPVLSPINDVSVTIQSRSVQYQQNSPVDVMVQGEYAEKRFDGKSVYVWNRSKELEIIDRWGNSEYRGVVSNDSRVTTRSFANGSGHLMAKHSIALLRLPSLIVAIDLNKLDQGAEPVRWQRVLSPQPARRINIAGEIDAIINSNSYAKTATASDPELGLCCVLTDGKLECIDAFTGRTVWQRPAPPNHTQLLADSAQVISLDSRQQSCQVFDLQTGRRLEKIKIPDLADVFWIGSGSRFISASVVRESRLEETTGFVDYRASPEKNDNDDAKKDKTRSVSLKSNRIFCCFDFGNKEFVWKKRFAMQAKACRMPGNRIVVLSDDNQVYMFDSLTGETLSQFASGLSKLERKSIKHVGVAKFGGRDVLLFAKNKSTSHSAAGIRMRATRALNTFFSGHVLLLDATSNQPVWQRPVELEGFQILPMLPSGSPLLLCCRHVESTASRSKSQVTDLPIPRNSLHVLGIDWETGQAVVNTMAGTTNVQSFGPARVDPNQGTIKFDLSSRSIHLKLQRCEDMPPSPVASITAFNPVPLRRFAPAIDPSPKTQLVDLPKLNNQLAEKARNYEAALKDKRRVERRQLELEFKQPATDR